jgi:hypothetical protein
MPTDEETTMKSLWNLFACGLIAVGVLASSSPAYGQAKTGSGVERTVTTGDGWQIHITYWEATGGKDSPVVVLLPSAEGPEDSKSRTRKAWDGMAGVLHKKGYAVVTADLRKHGDSAPASENANDRLRNLGKDDYILMAAQDMEAIKNFLVDEHQKEKLNIRKLGIAAAGSTCMVASGFALGDWMKKPWPDAPTLALRTPKGQDVRAIMMLSPNTSVTGINANQVMRALADPSKAIAINAFYNASDRDEKKAAESLYKMIKLRQTDDEDARKIIEGPAGKAFSAEGFLEQSQTKSVMEKAIPEFFDKYVKQREDPWRTRTSRLE